MHQNGKEVHIMEPIPQSSWDALSESAKAFANLILGENQTNLLRDNLASYSQLEAENKRLKVEVASLKETLPFKDKYENLQKEFRKVAAERDSLSSQALQFNHMSKDYDRLKDAYQKTKGQLAALQDQLESSKTSINQFTALETLYQGFKDYCSRNGVDIRRIPTNLFLQFHLQDGSNRTMNLGFNRVSKDKWTRIR
jgi:DNA repair exonuclease SbcCD ATPase subunit